MLKPPKCGVKISYKRRCEAHVLIEAFPGSSLARSLPLKHQLVKTTNLTKHLGFGSLKVPTSYTNLKQTKKNKNHTGINLA